MRSSQLSGLLWCCNSEGLANSVLGAGREPRLAASAVEDDAAFIPALDEAGLRKVSPWEKIAYLRREGWPRLAQGPGLGEKSLFE